MALLGLWLEFFMRDFLINKLYFYSWISTRISFSCTKIEFLSWFSDSPWFFTLDYVTDSNFMILYKFKQPLPKQSLEQKVNQKLKIKIFGTTSFRDLLKNIGQDLTWGHIQHFWPIYLYCMKIGTSFENSSTLYLNNERWL